MALLNFDAYTGRDLARTSALLADGRRAGIRDATELAAAIQAELQRRAERAELQPAAQQRPVARVRVRADAVRRCPSCGRGVVVLVRRQGIGYRACSIAGRAGCGWSQLVEG